MPRTLDDDDMDRNQVSRALRLSLSPARMRVLHDAGAVQRIPYAVCFSDGHGFTLWWSTSHSLGCLASCLNF